MERNHGMMAGLPRRTPWSGVPAYSISSSMKYFRMEMGTILMPPNRYWMTSYEMKSPVPDTHSGHSFIQITIGYSARMLALRKASTNGCFWAGPMSWPHEGQFHEGSFGSGIREPASTASGC
jgi:hypothetical protein